MATSPHIDYTAVDKLKAAHYSDDGDHIDDCILVADLPKIVHPQPPDPEQLHKLIFTAITAWNRQGRHVPLADHITQHITAALAAEQD